MEIYHKLKGQAQKIIKQAATEHWQSYCETLKRTSNLSQVWRMAKKMNGVVSQHRISTIDYEGKKLRTTKKCPTFLLKTLLE